jgi:hypothetical protein
VAYFFSGHSGIYGAQRVGVSKRDHHQLPPDLPLRDVRKLQTMSPKLPSAETRSE